MFLAPDHRHHSPGFSGSGIGVTSSVMQASSFSIRHDERAGLLHVIGAGIWDVSTADRHFGALDTQLAKIRASGTKVRVLVDLRRAGQQSAETLACLRGWTGRLYVAGDRVAIIVASSVAKATMRSMASRATRELFLSESAAHTWVMAYA